MGRLEREVQPLTAAIHKRLDDLTRGADDASAALMTRALAQQERTLWIGGLLALMAVEVGVFLAHVVTRRNLSSVKEAMTVATALSEGELGVAARVRRRDEIGQMLAAGEVVQTMASFPRRRRRSRRSSPSSTASHSRPTCWRSTPPWKPRAGEQGRGFAVVAAEVRALAQRSSQAAGEIRGLINSSVEGVQYGAKRAAGASDKIAHVGQSIEEVSTMIRDVSTAATRQSREIDAISRSIGELDGLTQSNTRMVGSWTDRASHLRAEVQRLAQLVGRFRLPEMEQPAAVAPAALEGEIEPRLPAPAE